MPGKLANPGLSQDPMESALTGTFSAESLRWVLECLRVLSSQTWMRSRIWIQQIGGPIEIVWKASCFLGLLGLQMTSHFSTSHNTVGIFDYSRLFFWQLQAQLAIMK